MPEKVDLYNTSYGNSEVDVYSEVRHETYGLDLGQTSWVSERELAEIPRTAADQCCEQRARNRLRRRRLRSAFWRDGGLPGHGN